MSLVSKMPANSSALPVADPMTMARVPASGPMPIAETKGNAHIGSGMARVMVIDVRAAWVAKPPRKPFARAEKRPGERGAPPTVVADDRGRGGLAHQGDGGGEDRQVGRDIGRRSRRCSGSRRAVQRERTRWPAPNAGSPRRRRGREGWFAGTADAASRGRRLTSASANMSDSNVITPSPSAHAPGSA